MKYRDMLGFPKKKEKKKVVPVVPEEPKPSVTDLLKEEFGGTINEGPETADGRRRVGAGYTLNVGNPGAGVTELYIPLKSLYIRDHGLETGEQLTYNTNVGAGLSVMVDTDTGTQISTLEDGTTVSEETFNIVGVYAIEREGIKLFKSTPDTNTFLYPL